MAKKVSIALFAVSLLLANAVSVFAGENRHPSKNLSNVVFETVVKLTPEEEVGSAAPGDVDGKGNIALTFKPLQEEICFDLEVENLGTLTRAHIHNAPRGENGGITVFFFDTVIDDPIPVQNEGCVDVDFDTILEILLTPDQYYVNIHTDENPAGAIRGQLPFVIRPKAKNIITRFKVDLNPEEEVGPAAPGDIDGSGEMTLRFNLKREKVCFKLDVDNLGTLTRAHIHNAPRGENGGITVFFFDTVIDDPIPVRLKGCVDVDADTMLQILEAPDQYYVNIHTDENPAGAIRGQLR